MNIHTHHITGEQAPGFQEKDLEPIISNNWCRVWRLPDGTLAYESDVAGERGLFTHAESHIIGGGKISDRPARRAPKDLGGLARPYHTAACRVIFTGLVGWIL